MDKINFQLVQNELYKLGIDYILYKILIITNTFNVPLIINTLKVK